MITMANTKVVFKYESEFNDYRFRSIVLPSGMKVMLLNGFYYNGASIGINVVGAGNLSQAKEGPSLLPRLVAKALYPVDDENECDKTKLRENFEGKNMTVDIKDSEDFSSFHIEIRDNESELNVALAWISAMLSSPTFPVAELEKAYKEIKDEITEEFTYDEKKRMDFLNRVLADRCHPFSNKYYGFTRESGLSGDNLRAAVVAYYESHYHPSKMYALIQSSLSLDEMQDFAEDSFGKLQSNNANCDSSIDPEYKNKSPFGPEQYGKLLKIVPVDESEDNTLLVQFHVATGGILSEREDYNSIGAYLSGLLNYDDPVLETLKDEKGWIRSKCGKYQSLLSTYVTHPFDGCVCFNFKIKLSEAGMDNVGGVVGTLLGFIRFLEEKGDQSWYLEEMKSVQLFRRRMYNNCVIEHAWLETALDEFTLTRLPESVVKSIYGTNVVDKLNSDLVAAVLAQLVGKNARITVLSRSFEGAATEELLGIKYYEENIDAETLETCDAIRKGSINFGIDFKLPSPSPGMPLEGNPPFCCNLDHSEESPNQNFVGSMQTLQSDDLQLSNIWFMQNEALKLPEVYVRIEISSPAVTVDHKSRVLNLMYGFLADECTRAVEIRALYPNTCEISTGVMIGLEWYSATISEAVQLVLKQFANFVPDEKSFKSLRFTWMGTEVSILKSDDAYLFGRTGEAILTPLMTPRDKLAAYKEITYVDMLEYAKKFQERMTMKWFVYGNIGSESVVEMVKDCEKIFAEKGTILAEDAEIHKRGQIMIPQDIKWKHTFETDTKEASDTTIYFQNIEFDPKSNVIVAFLAHLLLPHNEGWFVSTEQLHSPDARNNLYIYVNSSEKGPKEAESMMDTFLFEFRNKLESMEESDYLKRRDAFLNRWWNPRHHDSIVEKWFQEIVRREYDFKRYEEQEKQLKTVGLKEFTRFYEEFVGLVPGKVRRLILVVGKGPDLVDNIPSQPAADLGNNILDLKDWTSQQVLVVPDGTGDI